MLVWEMVDVCRCYKVVPPSPSGTTVAAATLTLRGKGTAVLWHHAAAGGRSHADLGGHLRSHLRRATVDRSLHVGELSARDQDLLMGFRCFRMAWR